MTYDYDKLYGETPEALGAPNAVFAAFFDRWDRVGARVLDVGCGQGRDALAIARRGHRVVGVDLSPNGIRDMLAAAQAEGLAVEGIVADITGFAPEGVFDAIVIDRVLHMLPPEARLAVLGGLLGHVAEGGWVLIADEAANMGAFEAVFERDDREWEKEVPKRGYLLARGGDRLGG
jgi:SAM-dependent methyltransferase